MVDKKRRDDATDATLPPAAAVPADLTLPPDPATPEPSVDASAELGPGDPGPGSEGADVLAVGARLGRHIVVERLGAGAMGVVYAGYDPKLDRKVALKLLRPRPGGDQARRTARLEREARAVAKLSHPNVIGIFDVLVEEGHLVLAMEYLAGGTLTEWLAAKKRLWREVLRMFIEVGKGLAAAHAEGQIHRDFKPDNVLLDKNGVPKVVDFGLVRSASTTGAQPDAVDTGDLAEATQKELAAIGAEGLTRTGAILGTPAYMAPEQFLSRPVDARTDQFAYCVALYEALYGERPFPGDTALKLAHAVTSGNLRPPKGSDVPGWVRACVLRGLAVEPADRFPDLAQLVAALARDPIARRKRRLGVTAGAVVLVGGVLTARHFALQRQQEIDRQAAEQIAVADRALTEAGANRVEMKALSERAFAAFDHFQQDKGEELWAQNLAAVKTADAGYLSGIQKLEAAFELSPRAELKSRVARAMCDYIELPGRTLSERQDELRQLARYDEDGACRSRLSAPARVHLETMPANVVVHLDTYDPTTFQAAGPSKKLGTTPLDLSLEPGSYRLTFDETATHVGFRLPVVLGAGETRTALIRVPTRLSVPEGFIYIPEGRFLFGSPVEDLRTAFLYTVPLHAVETPAFLISRFETTIGDWIAYLDALSPQERERRRPQGKRDGQGGQGGFVDVHRTPHGTWEIAFRATNKIVRAEQGRPFRYDDREQLAAQNWLHFPVSGISPEAALDYVAWLNRSGRVPGARLCSEWEWERAARGADGREFPAGHPPRRAEANFDLTYGRKSAAYGPDEVGSHPASASPFDVHDTVGNVWEITTSALDAGQFVSRGGSFYQNLRSSVSTNREPIASVTSDHTIGLRVCADVRL